MITKVKKPTIKQAKAIANIINGDSVSKAMRKAGYAPSTAKNPSELTNSITFTQILESTGITDQKLSDVLLGGLEADKTILGREGDTDTQPDHPTRLKALEIALKLKGYSKDSVNTITNNNTILPVLVKFINAKDN